jgi:hypothetical protein
MRNTTLVFVAALVAGACHYSGHLNTGEGPNGVRVGSIAYRTDGSESAVAARRSDAIRKIEKYCGHDGYTITKEDISTAYPEGGKEIQYHCGLGSPAPATVGNAQTTAGPSASASPGAAPSPANAAP